MDEKLRQLESPCPSCGAVDNDPDATFCEACGWKLGARLVQPLPPPEPCDPGKAIASRFTVKSLLWTAPTYNAYEAVTLGSPETFHTIIEQRLTTGDPLAGLSPVGVSPDGSNGGRKFQAASKTPRRPSSGSGSLTPSSTHRRREPLHRSRAHQRPDDGASGQTDKRARAVAAALRAFRQFIVTDGPKRLRANGIVLDNEGRVRLLCFDRARQSRSASARPDFPARYLRPSCSLKRGVRLRSDVY